MRKTIMLATLLLAAACDDIFEQQLGGRSVAIVAPMDGAVANEGEITFLWRPLDGARGYHLTVVSPSFANAAVVAADTILVNDSATVHRSYSLVLPAGMYQWSVSGFNHAHSSEEQILNLSVLQPPAEEEPES